jgi:peptidoglycan/xylan/chitin deacetylase (PgdA/CDA1 family)
MDRAILIRTNLWKSWTARGFELPSLCPATTFDESRAWPPRWPPNTPSVTIPSPTHTSPGVREELERGQEALQGATGTLPTVFRVPHGWYGPQVISTAGELGLRCVGWSVMAWDWNRPPPDTIRRRILRGAGPGGITLLHDGQDTDAFPEADRSRTIAAVPQIIRTLKNSGYSFATVPELMSLDAAHGHP